MPRIELAEYVVRTHTEDVGDPSSSLPLIKEETNITYLPKQHPTSQGLATFGSWTRCGLGAIISSPPQMGASAAFSRLCQESSTTEGEP